jgi:hypothetical protein
VNLASGRSLCFDPKDPIAYSHLLDVLEGEGVTAAQLVHGGRPLALNFKGRASKQDWQIGTLEADGGVVGYTLGVTADEWTATIRADDRWPRVVGFELRRTGRLVARPPR